MNSRQRQIAYLGLLIANGTLEILVQQNALPQGWVAGAHMLSICIAMGMKEFGAPDPAQPKDGAS